MNHNFFLESFEAQCENEIAAVVTLEILALLGYVTSDV